VSATGAARALSRDVLDNPFAYEKLLRLYAPRGVAIGMSIPVVVTAVYTVVNALRGAAPRGSVAVSWGLVAALGPLMIGCGAALRARRRRAFMGLWWAQSLVQFVWLQHLCWTTTPLFTAVGATLFCLWAFNDAFVGYDGYVIKAQYLLAFPAFDVFLLGLDAAGQRGILHAFTHERDLFDALLAVQAALTLVTQMILYYAGTEALAHDRRVVEMASLERDLAVMRTERRVLQRSSAYLLQGIAATRFCHDIRSPLQGIVGNLALLRDLLARPPHEGDDALDALAAIPSDLRVPFLDALDRWLRDASDASDAVARGSGRLAEMTRAVASSIRDLEAQRLQPIGDLLADALRETSATLEGHGVAAVAPAVDIEEAAVAVTEGHAGTLGNLLANSALQRPGGAVEVRGRAAGEWFYHLALRDHGVAADAREEALAKIRRSLSLEVARDPSGHGPDADRAYQGYGVALMIAKVFLTRYGGAIAVAAPAAGDGVVFHLLLPRTPYDQVPTLDAPEDVLARAMSEDAR